MTAPAHLIVPIKPLHRAKSRLLGAAGDEPGAHTELVAALAWDTVTAARDADGVRAVVVVTSDPDLTERFTAAGIEVLGDPPGSGLNNALRHAEAVLRARAPVLRLGALQADLPALRSDELAAALTDAGARRAFCADRHGTGTTLLLAEPGRPLDPRFGPDSARAHAESGAQPLTGRGPSLRCDVDTEQDLRAAAELGLGAATGGRLGNRFTTAF